jgi:RNA polymerase sigma factor (sigma-70 family)
VHELTEKHLMLARAIGNSYNPGEVTRCDFHSLAYYGLALALHSFDPENEKGAKFETWARIRIHGTIRDYLRKNDTLTRGGRRAVRALDAPYMGGMVPLEEVGHMAAFGPDPERQAQLAMLVDVLLPAVARLPKRLRQVVRLVDLQEQSHSEAAAALGISPKTVSHYRLAALAALREKLAA